MKQRCRIVQAYRARRATGMPEAEAARQTSVQWGCSPSSVRNYTRAWNTQGKAGLMPIITVRTYRPKTPWEVIQIIILLRRLLQWGGDRIAAELKSRGLYHISGQGVYQIFKRYRLHTRTRHPVGQRKGIAYRRWDVKQVNDVWHLDFAGPFVTPTGQKCWVLVGVDAYSRLLLTLTVVTTLDAQTVCMHLSELFTEYGTPKRIVTDNGPTFASVWDDGVHVFTDFLTVRKIAHHRIPPYYPEANGKAEAAVKIVKREALTPFFKTMPTWNLGQLQQLLTRFQTYYNCHRLHGGIGWQTPAQRWFTQWVSPPRGLEQLFFITEPELHFEFC
jgi:transposase InsO family protein